MRAAGALGLGRGRAAAASRQAGPASRPWTLRAAYGARQRQGQAPAGATAGAGAGGGQRQGQAPAGSSLRARSGRSGRRARCGGVGPVWVIGKIKDAYAYVFHTLFVKDSHCLINCSQQRFSFAY